MSKELECSCICADAEDAGRVGWGTCGYLGQKASERPHDEECLGWQRVERLLSSGRVGRRSNVTKAADVLSGLRWILPLSICSKPCKTLCVCLDAHQVSVAAMVIPACCCLYRPKLALHTSWLQVAMRISFSEFSSGFFPKSSK